MSNTQTVTLDEPIVRGEFKIEKVTLIRPKSGALRGSNLSDLLSFNVNALAMVLPRITDPKLTQAEVLNMDPADLTQCGGAVASFLLPKSAMEPETAAATTAESAKT